MAETSTRKQWQVPAYGSDPQAVHVWMKQQVDDGNEYFTTSPGFEQLEESIRLLSGKPTETLAMKQKNGYSRVQTNRIKRNLREMVNSLSEIRYNPGYSSDNRDVHDQAVTLNKYAEHWYTDRFVDLKIKKAVQWMAITPCGWLEIMYRQIPGERNKRVIDLQAHSAFDVVMTGVPESGDFQEAYTVTIIKDLPVYLAHAIFPDHQDKLKPDRETPRGWLEKIRDKAQNLVNDVFSTEPEKATAKNPTVRLYYQYVLDLSINKSGKEMKMGYGKGPKGEEIETPWAYKVPSVGQPILAGYQDKDTPVYRSATPEDCRIFPGRRLLIDTETDNIYDGPMFDWHGKVPLIKFCADSWPFAEFSMVHDVAPIQETINEMERTTHQTARNRFAPSILYNMRSISREKAKAIRTDITGQRIGYNGNEGNDPTKPLLPKEFYNVEEWIIKFFESYLSESMDRQMGVNDISALAKMKANPNSDSVEKFLEAAGPIVRGISRDMERQMRDLAEMFKFYVIQYITAPQIIQVLGVDGATPENFDWDPGNLIPSHLPGENEKFPSIYTKRERAKWAGDHLTFKILPGTMHEIVQTSQKMMFLQLWRNGFPIDPWTLAEVLRLGNFGKKPEGANSMFELWVKWQEIQLELKAAMAAKMQSLEGGGEGGDQGGSPNASKLGPGGGQKGTGGRPSSGETSPKLQTKGDGRTIMRESK